MQTIGKSKRKVNPYRFVLTLGERVSNLDWEGMEVFALLWLFTSLVSFVILGPLVSFGFYGGAINLVVILLPIGIALLVTTGILFWDDFVFWLKHQSVEWDRKHGLRD